MSAEAAPPALRVLQAGAWVDAVVLERPAYHPLHLELVAVRETVGEQRERCRT